MTSEQCWIISENNWFSLRSFLENTDSALNITDFLWFSHENYWRWKFKSSPKNTLKTSQLTSVTFFSCLKGLFLIFKSRFCSGKKLSDMETNGNTDFRKIIFLEFFKKNLLKFMLKISISRPFSINNKKTPFLVVFMVFVGLLLASNVQRWIRDVQKCSSLNQLWPEMSKLKSAGTALNIAENAKISKSALKMTEYL